MLIGNTVAAGVACLSPCCPWTRTLPGRWRRRHRRRCCRRHRCCCPRWWWCWRRGRWHHLAPRARRRLAALLTDVAPITTNTGNDNGDAGDAAAIGRVWCWHRGRWHHLAPRARRRLAAVLRDARRYFVTPTQQRVKFMPHLSDSKDFWAMISIWPPKITHI